MVSEIFSESRAWENFAWQTDGLTRREWFWGTKTGKAVLSKPEVLSLGLDWCKHPELTMFEKGMKQAYDELDEFLLGQGYEHIRGTGKYKIVEPSEKRIAIFAHGGYGTAFLSCLLDIPFPLVALHFDLRTTGVTAINFKNTDDGFCIPCVYTFSNDGHLYADNLPTNQGDVFF